MKKILSIKQPWATLIALGIKDIENRTWPTKYRGTVFIHSSAKPFKGELHEFLIEEQYAYVDFLVPDVGAIEFPVSAVIGKFDIVDCVQLYPSVWAEIETADQKPIYNFVIDNVVMFEKPVLGVKGKLGLCEALIDYDEIREH